MKTTTVCPICSKEFTRVTTKDVRPVYCSHSCASKGERRRASNTSGPEHPLFKRETIRTWDGASRVYVWIDDEMRLKLRLKTNRTARARVVWLQAHPGEMLTRRQPIHHSNGDTMDDRPENLERIESNREHNLLHADGWGWENRDTLPDKPCAGCEKPIRPWRKWCSTECMNAHRRGSEHFNTGLVQPPEIRARIAATLTGRKDSEEVKAHKREAHLKRWAERKADPSYQKQSKKPSGRW